MCGGGGSRRGGGAGEDWGRPDSKVDAVPGCEVTAKAPPAGGKAGTKRKREGAEEPGEEGVAGGKGKGLSGAAAISADAPKGLSGERAGGNPEAQGGAEEDAVDDDCDGDGDDDDEEETPNQMFALYENFRRSKGKVEKLRGSLRAGVVNIGGRDFTFGSAQSAFDWG